MLTRQESERLVRIGPGTPGGDLFRRYWQPALLSSELPENDGAPVRVRLLGEDLVAFRDTNGDVGLVGAFCPHRRAPMFFGRNEECGLRCVYHGWKFDRNGTCVDMPSEPPDSLFKTKVTIDAYPIWEGGGLVWTYMGPRELQPPRPNYEWLRAPSTHCRVSKTLEDANYLQALEGGLDTAHSSFAHNEKLGDRTYNMVWSYDRNVPITDEWHARDVVRFGRGADDLIPGTFKLKKTLANDFMIDRQMQKTKNYTGIIGVNTACAPTTR